MNLPENATTSAFVAAPPRLPDIAPHAEVGPSETTIINPIADVVAPAGSRAVVYLRVSSKGQVNTDYDPEGISIPAQRQSCQRKAEQLGLSIVAEYVEAGISGTEMTKRVAFQQMLERIRRDKDVDYVIVYKLSRFARNRTDDAIVMADLQKRGVTLISATESIDSTPVGQLMHGILAAFNEYRSREDGADIAYKMAQKAKNGGTLGKAPIGYINTLERIEGREFRGIAVDEERAPFVKLAFELYDKGELSMEDIADILTERGLETRATARRPAGPVSGSKISAMLRDPYYVGDIVYKGETYEGRHPAIIDRDLFVRVQQRLEASGRAGERKRVYPHYLKGSLWCGECYAVRGLVDKRMIIQRSIGNAGGEYFYFFCRGKQQGVCDSRHIPFEVVEDQVIEHYRTVQLRPEFIEWVHGQIDNALQDQAGSRRQLRDQIQGQIARLQTRVDNLIDLVADGGLAGSKAREKITEIERERAGLEARLGTIEDDLSIGAAFLKGWLELLRDPYELYRTANNDMRRDLNQAIFTRIFVIDQDRAESELQEHVRLLLEAQAEWATTFGLGIEAGSNENDAEASSHSQSIEGHWRKPVDLALGSSKQSLVPLEGLEPPTLSLGRNCSSIELQRRCIHSKAGVPALSRRAARSRCRARPRAEHPVGPGRWPARTAGRFRSRPSPPARARCRARRARAPQSRARPRPATRPATSWRPQDHARRRPNCSIAHSAQRAARGEVARLGRQPRRGGGRERRPLGARRARCS